MSTNNSNDPEDNSPTKGDRPPGKESAEGSFESDLWNLDNESTDPLPAKKIRSADRRIPPTIPKRGQREKPLAGDEKKPPIVAVKEVEPEPRKHDASHIRLNMRPQNETSWPAVGSSKNASFSQEFDELEEWVDDGGVATGKEVEDAAKLTQIDKKSVEEHQAPIDAPEEIVEPAQVEEKSAEVPPQPPAAPAVERRRSDYSMLEKFGMAALVIALLAIFAGILIYSSTSLPVESLESRKVKFPIVGKDLTVRSAKTYWRDVVRSGPESDVVRRGTRLLPVVELSYSGGPAVIRVIFRDEKGDSVGDAITRRVEADSNVTISATAGFNDVGMHAAYRTNENDPWKIEVYEVSGTNVSDEGFAKLFEMDISADRR